jgi:2-polyprenyl-3-methyl-5-hydroxy-6-metoxy-1,4-benzoquinol methylase
MPKKVFNKANRNGNRNNGELGKNHMNWTAGYNNSVAYTMGYHHEQSPTYLNACLAMQRVAPPELDSFTYCELGFGQGLTSLILAATHPDGDFYACDFNPLHVLAASSIKQEANLQNLTLLENSFGELAQGRVDLPMFDYVTMHGIISWISDETRAQIVTFLSRYLKPGGVVQVSYNAMIGCAQVLPLQRLLRTHAGEKGDDWRQASELATKLAALGSEHFAHNPDSLGRVKDFDKLDARYLVHEYMHETWTPFYFADIAREFAEAKLTYAGSARFSYMSPVAWLSDEQRIWMDGVGDPVRAEELRDYFANRAFRSDIFVRGRVTLNDSRLREQAARVHLWGNPDVEYASVVSVEHTSVTRVGDYHRAMFDLLHRSEATLADIFDAPEFAGLDLDYVLKLVRLSLAANETSLRYGPMQPRAAADRLNAVLLARMEQGEGWPALATTRLGGGAGVSGLDQLLMASLNEKEDRTKSLGKDILELSARVARSMQTSGLNLTIAGDKVDRDDVSKRIGHIFADSGAKLIAHCVAQGFWTEPKAGRR